MERKKWNLPAAAPKFQASRKKKKEETSPEEDNKMVQRS